MNTDRTPNPSTLIEYYAPSTIRTSPNPNFTANPNPAMEDHSMYTVDRAAQPTVRDLELEVNRLRSIIRRLESNLMGVRGGLVGLTATLTEDTEFLPDNWRLKSALSSSSLILATLDRAATNNALNIGQPVKKGGE